jgi:hypothetical protein
MDLTNFPEIKRISKTAEQLQQTTLPYHPAEELARKSTNVL